METPLYEYDQVITNDELVGIIETLMYEYNKIPKWKFIPRLRMRSAIGAILGLYDALYLKSHIHNHLSKGDSQ